MSAYIGNALAANKAPTRLIFCDSFKLMKPFLTLLVSLFCWHAAADETKVLVHLLDHTDAKNTEYRFWIDWNSKWRGIVASKTVTGEKAGSLSKCSSGHLKRLRPSISAGTIPFTESKLPPQTAKLSRPAFASPV